MLENELRELRQRVDRLERIARRRARRTGGPRRDGAFLVGLARVVGARVFSAVELIALARIHPEFAAHLRDHDVSSAGRLGYRLRSLNGTAVDGYRVTSVGRDEHGQTWAIELAES